MFLGYPLYFNFDIYIYILIDKLIVASTKS